jgi:hypothetical protein
MTGASGGKTQERNMIETINAYGKLEFVDASSHGIKAFWQITAAPHVMIRLKNVFPRVDKNRFGTVTLESNQEVCRDLEWFISRYPLEMDMRSAHALKMGADGYRKQRARMEAIMLPTNEPRDFKLALPLRDYQARAVDLYITSGGLLVADQVGLGKTVTAIGSFTVPELLPVLVVCQTHLTTQWQNDFLARFLPDAMTHIIKSVKPYDLPPASVYIISYHKLSGWAEVLRHFIKSIVFDEVQELRHGGTGKYRAAEAIRANCTHALGLSATPIYNYGGEMFNVMEIVTPGKLGSETEFNREWCYYNGKKQIIKDPAAFGEYLRDNHLMIRRTRKDVGLELPEVEKVVQTIPYAPEVLDEIKNVATELAKIIMEGSFEESGQAAREFDLKLRMATGIAKAVFVAEFVKMLVEDGQQVLLFGWHRAVYDIWIEQLRVYQPVLYTGSETAQQKTASLERFKNRWAKVMIMSLRSGSGVDGLQNTCSTAVFGELDWSPGVHEQCIGRLNRDGSLGGVSAFFLVADGGSDPVVAEVLGLKTEQVRGMVDPQKRESVVAAQVDMARVKRMAQAYLERRHGQKEYVKVKPEGGVQTLRVIDAPSETSATVISGLPHRAEHDKADEPLLF